MPAWMERQLLVEVRKDPVLASIPVLVVSTDRSDARARRMKTLGADGYVSKPFQPAELSEQMYRLLGGAPDESM